MSKIVRTYRFRLYPSKEQTIFFARAFGCKRYVWNRALDLCQEDRKTTGKRRNINEIMKLLPAWKEELTDKDTGEHWLRSTDATSLQQTLRDLDKAYTNHATNPAHFNIPKHKKKNTGRQSYRTTNITITDKTHVRLPKIGKVKAKISQPVIGRLTSATITRTPSGRYFISIVTKDALTKIMPPGETDMVGIDVGVKTLATCSNGTILENTHIRKKYARKLAREQRRLARKKKGGKNYKKQRARVARVYERVVDARLDNIQKFTTSVVRDSQGITVEDLNVEGMKHNHRLAGAVTDASMSEIIRELKYKCEWYDRDFVQVSRWFASSKTCHVCGHVYKELSLSEREWVCSSCGAHHDRDMNAALNLRDEGLRLLSTEYVGSCTVGHTETRESPGGGS